MIVGRKIRRTGYWYSFLLKENSKKTDPQEKPHTLLV